MELAITIGTPPAPSDREAIDRRCEEALAASQQGNRERAKEIVLEIFSDVSSALGEVHRVQSVIYSVAAALAAGNVAARDLVARDRYRNLAFQNAKIATHLSPESSHSAYLCASLVLTGAKDMEELKRVHDICEGFLVKFEDAVAAFTGLSQLAKVKALLITNFETEDMWFTFDRCSAAAKLAKSGNLEDVIPLLGPIKEAVELYCYSLSLEERSELTRIRIPDMMEKYETLYDGKFYLLLKESVFLWKTGKVWTKWLCPCNTEKFTNITLFEHHIKEHSGLGMTSKAVVDEADGIINDDCLIFQDLDYSDIFGCDCYLLESWNDYKKEKWLTAASTLMSLKTEASRLEGLRGKLVSNESKLRNGVVEMVKGSLGDEAHILNLKMWLPPMMKIANPFLGSPTKAETRTTRRVANGILVYMIENQKGDHAFCFVVGVFTRLLKETYDTYVNKRFIRFLS
ncbi:ubiquitin carboxyl-terminal hydrolase-related protein, partial [Striga asiatica]